MDILFRLLKEKEDGSFEVCGYEKHEGGVIFHKRLKDDDYTVCGREYTCGEWYDVRIRYSPDGSGENSSPISYIPHDRKDLYTGIEVDGVKVFHRDRWAYKREDVKSCFIQWNKDGACFMIGDDEIGDNIEFIRHDGIHGVTP